EEAIASGSVKVPANGDARAEKAMMLAVASQPQSGGSTFATGADVSRFQRSTVPGKANGAAGMTPQGVTQATVSTGMPGDASGLPMGP
ncbi:hypothetical protein ACQJ11_26790, partial [Klebsiella pneumoniae]